MVAHISTVAFIGIDARHVDVQVQMASGLPAFIVVGLPDKAVAESKERVRAALSSVGLALPPKRITVNLAPADMPKEGSHYDLPIAVGLLVAMGVLPADEIERYTVLGELSLDGGITAVAGVLPAAVEALAQERGIICPEACGGEAAWAGDLPGDGDRIDRSALIDLVIANRGKRGFTYTHYPMSPQNRELIRWANTDGFAVNLSGDNPEHADTLADLDIAPVVTILPADTSTKTSSTPAGRLIATCPATYRDDVSCASCQLCQRVDRKVIVGFPVHGSRKRAAAEALKSGGFSYGADS